MRAVVQRVERASVAVAGNEIARIGKGILALVAISGEDSQRDLEWMAKKIVELRIFDDQEGRLNLSLLDVGGQLLLVSQFTLFGDCRKGRRPSYSEAAPPAKAQALYDAFVGIARQWVPDVQSGQFQAAMEVELVNSGPVTLIIDSRDKFNTHPPISSPGCQ
jgi:D-tyrosyl-tRNA(Tyr) deacylase